jgi:hypothetical protein
MRPESFGNYDAADFWLYGDHSGSFAVQRCYAAGIVNATMRPGRGFVGEYNCGAGGALRDYTSGSCNEYEQRWHRLAALWFFRLRNGVRNRYGAYVLLRNKRV